MTKPVDQLLNDLASEGGCIVCSDRCSEIELAYARTEGRFYVREDGIGFVRRYAEWITNAEQLICDLKDTFDE